MTPFSLYNISKSDKDEIIRYLKYLKKVSQKLSKISLEQEEGLIRDMRKKIPIPVYSTKDIFLKEEIHRISINQTVRDDSLNGRLNHLGQLKYPPLDKAYKLGYNRASLKKQSIFYSGMGNFWGAKENPYMTGQLVTHSTWKQKKDTTIRSVKIFQSFNLMDKNPAYYKDWNEFQNYLSNVSTHAKELIEELFSFITDEFIKPVNKNIEYLFSAFFSDAFFQSGVDVIIYPSVPNDYFAENFAINPTALDSKFDFVKADEGIVINDPTNSAGIFKDFFELVRNTKGVNTPDPNTSKGWQLQGLSSAKKVIGNDEELVWENSVSDEMLKELSERYNFII